jgi:hypothetical protein
VNGRLHSTNALTCKNIILLATEGYELEWGKREDSPGVYTNYVRFFTERGAVVYSATPAGWLVGTTYDLGDVVTYSGATYYSMVDNNLANTPDSSSEWTVVDDTIVEVPFNVGTGNDQYQDFKLTTSGDIIYITHRAIPPQELQRLGADNWILKDIVFGGTVDPPTNLTMTGSSNVYTATTVSDIDGSESETAVEVLGDPGNTLSWTAATNALYYNVYEVVNGVAFYLGIAEGTSYEIDSNAEPDLNRLAPSSVAIFDSTGNYPAVCGFYQQRLIFGRTDNKPQTFWGSNVGAFTNFNKSFIPRDDQAYEFTIDSGQINEIQSLTPLTDLIINTSGGEWRANSGTAGSITPNSISIQPQSRYGANDLQPLIIGNNVMFVENAGETVRNLLYSLDIDGYQGNDLTILAKHLVEGYRITAWTYQRDPYKIIWCIRDDGVLLGLTFDLENSIAGWHQHHTDGSFIDVSSITNSNSKTDTYLVTARPTAYKIELLRNPLETDDVRDSYYVDYGLSLDIPFDISDITQADPAVVTLLGHSLGFSNDDYIDISDVEGMTELNGYQFQIDNVTEIASPNRTTFTLKDLEGNNVDSTAFTAYFRGGKVREAVTVITGLSHLDDREVAVLANGNVVSGLTVSGGAITLPNRASRVHIGLPYTADLVPLDYVVTGANAQDKIKQNKTVVLQLQKSRALFVGPTEDKLLEVLFRTNEDFGLPIELFSGVKEKNLLDYVSQDKDATLFIRNTYPLPLNILVATVRINYGQR